MQSYSGNEVKSEYISRELMILYRFKTKAANQILFESNLRSLRKIYK